MQHNKKLCPAIVGMYYYVDGVTSPTEIARLTGWRMTSVFQILKRKYNVETTKAKHNEQLIEKIEREYIAGVSTYEIADKYGVDHSTISKWMNKRGHYRGKGYIPNSVMERNEAARIKARAEKAERRKLLDALVEQQKMEREAARKADKERKENERAAEYAKDKICASCGEVFHSEYATQLYCSDTCSRREKRHRNVASCKTKLNDYSNHRKRARKYGVSYEPGITLQKLIFRDRNTCQICGGQCDANDLQYGFSGPLYPSIDHIKPMSKGGSHTWDNVQLAHVICNSNKRDLWEVSA